MESFDQNNQLMLEESNPARSLERIQDSIQELLSNEWRDESKAEHLLKLLADSVNLQNRIKLQERRKEPSQKQLLDQTINEAQNQKSTFAQIEMYITKNHQSESNFTQRLIKILSNLLSSAYAIKQLEQLINMNQRSEEAIKLLTNISNELKKQYQVEQAAIEKGHESEKKQAKILQTIQDQMAREIKLKENEKQNLKLEIEKGLVSEMEEKRQYKDTLRAYNEKKIQLILHGEEQSLLFMNINEQKTAEVPKVSEKPVTAKLKFETIKIPPTYYYEKIIGIVLSILTIVLLASFMVRQ